MSINFMDKQTDLRAYLILEEFRSPAPNGKKKR